MRRWTVHRVWRNVKADTATEAIAEAQPGEHVETRCSAQYEGADALAQLYYTREELEALLSAVGSMVGLAEHSKVLAQSEELRARLQQRWNVLNSLRTSLAEARYGLMTREEIEAERAAEAEARAEGLIH